MSCLGDSNMNFGSETNYITNSIENFRISNAHLTTTLMDKNLHLNVDMKRDLANSQKYQSVVGSFFYQYILSNKHDINIHERTKPQEPHMVTLW